MPAEGTGLSHEQARMRGQVSAAMPLITRHLIALHAADERVPYSPLAG